MVATPEEIKAIRDATLKEIQNSPELLKKAAENAATDAKTYAEGISGIFNNLKSYGIDFISNFKSGSEALLKNKSILDEVAKSYVAFSQFSKTTDLFPTVAASSDTFGGLSNQIGNIKGNFIQFQEVANNLGFGGLTGKISKLMNNFGENAIAAEKSNQAMIQTLAAGGNLKTLFDSEGKAIGDINTQTMKYTSSLLVEAAANNQTLAATTKYAEGLYKIPGIMNENVNVGEKLGGSMSALNAAMKVMSGSGQDFNTVLSVMEIAYGNVGNSMGPVNDKAQKGIALFSMMSTLSKDLGLEFKETSGFLGEMARQFKFIGDNTEAAARIMSRFTDGLRNTGLTSGASIQIIKDMTEATSKLTIGTKAFVSARSGGPGGLQGAVQMDVMNREGKSDEVMQMVMNTMRQQFGGRIVTQAEGAQSQEAAATFTKQKMMLQSGVFGNLVGTGPDADNKATHLLEMLASGDVSGAVKTSQDAISEVANQGNELQKQSNTILNKISLNMERAALASQISALANVRAAAGYAGSFGNKLTDDMREASFTSKVGQTDKTVPGFSEKVTGKVDWLSNVSKLGPGAKKDYEDQMSDSSRKIIPEFLESIKNMGSAFKNEGAILSGAVEKSKEVYGKAVQGVRENIQADKIKRNIPVIQNPRIEASFERKEDYESLPAFRQAANRLRAQQSIPLPQQPLTRAAITANERARSSATQQRQAAVESNKNVNVNVKLTLDKAAEDAGARIVEVEKTIDNSTGSNPSTNSPRLINRNDSGY